MKIIINFVSYQLIWALCVIWENEFIWLALILIALHIILSAARIPDLKMMVFLLLAGSCIDGLLHFLGFFSFKASGMPIPLWLTVLWLGLATLPHHSLAWLKNKPLLAGLLGAIGGPLAYWAGVRLDAASFNLPLLPALAILAMIWGMLWPLTMYVADKTLPRNQ